MGLEIQTTDLFGRSGGTGIAANTDVINSAFSPQILIDGLNSDLIAITPSRNVTIRVLEHNQPQLQPLEDVRSEIQVLLQFEKINAQTLELGETIKTNYQNGQNIDSLLELQNLSWNQLNSLERSDQSLPPELVQNVFNMPAPVEGSPIIDGFELSSGGYVVVELQNVEEGSVDDFEDAELDSLKSFISQQSSNADLEALVLGMQERAEISR